MGYSYKKQEILENQQVAEGVYRLSIEKKVDVKPGQFFMIKGWEKEPILARPISVHDVQENKIIFLYAVVGNGTRKITSLKVGESIEVLGPLGNGFNVLEAKGKVAVIGGGIGVAPLIYLIKSLKGCQIDFYAGYRNKSNVVDNVEKNVNNFFLSTEDGSGGHKGYVTDLFSPEKYDVVYSCGPEVMMKKVVDMCKQTNTKVYVSMEKHMACGLGACLVCTCKTKNGNVRVCKDGPVFLGEEVSFDD